MASPFVPQSFMYGDLPQGGALTPIVVAARNPSNTIDKQYAAGYLWLSSLDMYQIVGGVPTYGSGNLYYQAGNSAGAPNWVLVSDASGPVVGIVGTANQITATNTAGTVTLTIPAVFIAPGSIASTTTMAAGTTLTAGTGITSTLGNIVAAAGNISATLGSVSAGTTVTGGTGVTATTGNITATNGNIVRGTAGNKDVYTSVATTTAAGANSAGTVTLVAGEAIVATTAVTAASQIRIYRQGVGATGAAALGVLSILTRTANVSFTIRAVQPADATAAQAADVSVVGWEIVN